MPGHGVMELSESNGSFSFFGVIIRVKSVYPIHGLEGVHVGFAKTLQDEGIAVRFFMLYIYKLDIFHELRDDVFTSWSKVRYYELNWYFYPSVVCILTRIKQHIAVWATRNLEFPLDTHIEYLLLKISRRIHARITIDSITSQLFIL